MLLELASSNQNNSKYAMISLRNRRSDGNDLRREQIDVRRSVPIERFTSTVRAFCFKRSRSAVIGVSIGFCLSNYLTSIFPTMSIRVFRVEAARQGHSTWVCSSSQPACASSKPLREVQSVSLLFFFPKQRACSQATTQANLSHTALVLPFSSPMLVCNGYVFRWNCPI